MRFSFNGRDWTTSTSKVVALVLSIISLSLGTAARPAGAATQTTTQTFSATADAFVVSVSPRTNYGASRELHIDGSPKTNAYVAFKVNGLVGTVKRVLLRLYSKTGSRVGYKARPVLRRWGERTITYRNAPKLGTGRRSSGRFRAARWTTVDVTPLFLGQGTVSFALTSSNAAAIRLASRESAHGPQLVIETATQTAPASDLSWPPPPLVDPITVNVPNNNGYVAMGKNRDYIVHVGYLRDDLWLEGGHNVVVIGGRVTIPSPGPNAYARSGVKVRSATGTVHLEGLLIDNSGGYLADGIVTSAPDAVVQVENVRIEGVHATGTEHPDIIQPQAGLEALRVDHLTASTTLQGIFLRHNTVGGVFYRTGPADLRNINIYGLAGAHIAGFWQDRTTIPIALQNFWVHPGASAYPFPYQFYPDPSQPDGRKATLSPDGTYIYWPTSNISGHATKGVPAGGDYVPLGVPGESYVSPGYAGG
jgi:hypothetical protein